MADQKISQMTPAATLAGTETVPLVQAGANKIATVAQLTSGIKTQVEALDTGLPARVRGEVAAMLLQGANMDFTQAGSGASRTISLSSTTPPYTLPPATSTVLGGVKPGTGVTIAADGTINASVTPPTATATTGGVITDAMAVKLDGIAVGAEVNVQADWNQATTTADDFIKNKPGDASVTVKGIVQLADAAAITAGTAGAAAVVDAAQLKEVKDSSVQSTMIRNMVSLTKTEYDALATKDAATFYVITGP